MNKCYLCIHKMERFEDIPNRYGDGVTRNQMVARCHQIGNKYYGLRANDIEEYDCPDFVQKDIISFRPDKTNSKPIPR